MQVQIHQISHCLKFYSWQPYFSELKELSGDRGGKKVLKRHWESVIPFLVEAAWELKDLDRKEDLCCRDTGGCHE